MELLKRQTDLPRSILRSRKSAISVAALLLAGGSGVALFLQQSNLHQRNKAFRYETAPTSFAVVPICSELGTQKMLSF